MDRLSSFPGTRISDGRIEKAIMTIELGLFDIHQVDPTDPAPTAEVFERRLKLLSLADRRGIALRVHRRTALYAELSRVVGDRLDCRRQPANGQHSAGRAGIHPADASSGRAGGRDRGARSAEQWTAGSRVRAGTPGGRARGAWESIPNSASSFSRSGMPC